MFNNKNELIKQVNWALRVREPLGFRAVSDVSAKWQPAGYKVRFDGGSAVIAHFEGRIVAIAWQQMGDVERHLFDKSRSTIAEHFQNIFNEGELQKDAVCRKYRRTAADGKDYSVQFYNLAILLFSIVFSKETVGVCFVVGVG